MDGFIIMVPKGPWNSLRNKILPAKVRPKGLTSTEMDRSGEGAWLMNWKDPYLNLYTSLKEFEFEAIAG